MGKSDIFKHLSFRINSEYLAQLNTVKQRTATTSSKVKKNEWMSHKNGKKKLKTIRQFYKVSCLFQPFLFLVKVGGWQRKKDVTDTLDVLVITNLSTTLTF